MGFVHLPHWHWSGEWVVAAEVAAAGVAAAAAVAGAMLAMQLGDRFPETLPTAAPEGAPARQAGHPADDDPFIKAKQLAVEAEFPPQF